MELTKRLYLDEVMSLDEAAEYLGVSRWWLQRRLSPYIAENNAPTPVAKIGHMELWTKEQIDALGPFPTKPWPEYATAGDSFGWEWKREHDSYHSWWMPVHPMAASNAAAAVKNAEAWRFVADNWAALNFQDEPSS